MTMNQWMAPLMASIHPLPNPYNNSIMYEEYLYKQELLNSFGQDGELVDNVKLQLREKIINKLKATKPASLPPTDASLLIKVCNTLVADYLEAQRLFHSLAVFAPEAGCSKHSFNREELQAMFSQTSAQEQSLLEALVQQALPRGRMVERRTETAAQTDSQQSIASLESRLGEVDFAFRQKMLSGLRTVEDSEARFLKYKAELNKRFREELDQEVTRIRNFELANIRMDEQERSKLRMRELEEELENSYRGKMEKLREREAEVIQRVTSKMKEVETYNFQARQRVLKDYETLKAREEELDRLRDQLLERERQLIGKQ
jgi:hypothetical protein